MSILSGWVTRPRKRTATLLGLLATLGAVLIWAYALIIRPWHLRWGASDEEVSKPLLGDVAIPEKEFDPAFGSTRAITVYAPVDVVVEEAWSWLERMPGPERRGFYKYEWLEDLSGIPELHDAERRHPEWHHRVTAHAIWLFPATGIEVGRVKPDYAVLWEAWGTFAVEPIDEKSARVILRSRVMRPRPGLYYRVFYHPLFGELFHFLVERRMLKGLKERIERAQTRITTELS